MSRLTDRIKAKLSEAWAKVSPPKPVTVENLLSAAEAGNEAKLKKLIANGGAAFLQSKTAENATFVSVLSSLAIVQNASPAAFELLMAQPEVDTLAKKVFLRNAVYHNKPALAETLLKDPAVGDRQEVQAMLNSEYIVHGLSEARNELGQLLIKYGANNETAERTYDAYAERNKAESRAQALAFEQRKRKFGGNP